MTHSEKKRRIKLMRKGDLLFGPIVTDEDRADPDFDGFCSVPLTRSRFRLVRGFATYFTLARRLKCACEIHDVEAMRVRYNVRCGVYVVQSRAWWGDVFVAHNNLRMNIKIILPWGIRKLYSSVYFGAIYLGSESFTPDRGPLAKLGPQVDEDEPGAVQS